MSLITYRSPVAADALRLSVLFHQVYIQTYALEGITTEFANFITRRFSPESIAALIRERPDALLAAYYRDNPVGVAELHPEAACPVGGFVAPELSKLYVLERFCGQGVGRELLGEAERRLRQSGHSQIWLEVWLRNERAIRFYEGRGYRGIGEVDFPMETHTYRNRVMLKALV